MTLSTLRFEPYFADISDCKEEYYGLPNCILWRIFIDEVLISNGALPFLASDEFIELEANRCIPYFGDGGPDITARLLEDKVLWFGFLPNIYYRFGTLPLPNEAIYVFSAAQYSQAIQQANAALSRPEPPKEAEPPFLTKFLNYVFGKSVVKPPSTTSLKAVVKPLPVLTSNELKDVLLNAIPYNFDLPLYRMPELADDRRGERLYRAVWDTISLQEIRISEPPPNPIEIRIGLDKDVFVESLWLVGKIGDDVAILFVSEPHFPLWLSGFQSIMPLLGEALNTSAGEE